MIKYTPQHFLAYGIGIYLFLFIFGPYSFDIRNIWAGAYLAAAYFLWFIGIKCANVKVHTMKSAPQTKKEWVLSDVSEYVLILLEILNLIALVMYGIQFLASLGIGNPAVGDFRKEASAMPFIYKIIQSESYLTVGIYIIVSYAKQVRSKWLRLLSRVGIFVPVAITMLSGARWTLFVVLIIFGIVEMTREKQKKTSRMLRFVLVVIIIGMLGICFLLFAVRGISSTYTKVMPYYGEIDTKYLWQVIGNSPLGKPVYSIFYYFTHSLPYYAEVFDMIDVGNIHYGAFMFRIVSFFFSGFPAYKDIVSEIPCLVGSYSTFITGYMRDFGLCGTPVMVFLTGLLMGKLYRARKRSSLALILQPYMLTMCILSPLYYIWHVGSIDFMLVTTIGLYIVLKFTNRIYIRK